MVSAGSRRVAIAMGLFVAALALPQHAHAGRVVYLNAEPTTLTNVHGHDPRQNSFEAGGFSPGSISGWPTLTPEQRELLTFFLKEATVPFDVVYTWERPTSGDYDMLVMGTAADSAALFPDLGCGAARSVRDCEDWHGPNVSFLFYACLPEDQQTNLHRVAFTALAALGLSWGLENVSVNGQVMGGYSGTALKFGNECVPTSNTAQCFHEGCPSNQQNSTADLVAYIGPRVDDGPPSVEVISPPHMSVQMPNFTVEAAVDDLYGGLQVQLTVVEAEQALAKLEPPYRWNLSAVPPGPWTLRVDAIDADGHEQSDEVVVCVQTCESGDDDDGSALDSGTGADTHASELTSGAGLDPTTPANSSGGVAPAGSVCHCHSSEGPRTAHLAALALLALATRRRRHRRVIRGG